MAIRRWVPLDKHGWPVERVIGRHVRNFIRVLLHTRRVVSRQTWEMRRADWWLADNTRSRFALTHDMEPHLQRMFRWCRENDLSPSHLVDVRVRINGRDELHEADWLRKISTQMHRDQRA
jgi:hypothetical protein